MEIIIKMNDPFQELSSDDELMEDLNPINARMKGNHDNEPFSRFPDEVVHDDLEYEFESQLMKS